MDGLTKRGGLLGISGVSNDLRDVQEPLTQEMTVPSSPSTSSANGIVRHIGAYYAELGCLDHLVFTGGIGEHGTRIRESVCHQLAHMGILLDDKKNQNCTGANTVISRDDSPVTIHVIPANEELGVARKTYAYLRT